MKLCKPSVGPRAHPPQIVVYLGQADGYYLQGARGLYQSIPCALRLEVVACFGDWQASLSCKYLDHLLGESRRGIDAGAGGCAALRNLRDSGESSIYSFDAVANLGGVTCKLLAKGDRGCIH